MPGLLKVAVTLFKPFGTTEPDGSAVTEGVRSTESLPTKNGNFTKFTVSKGMVSAGLRITCSATGLESTAINADKRSEPRTQSIVTAARTRSDDANGENGEGTHYESIHVRAP